MFSDLKGLVPVFWIFVALIGASIFTAGFYCGRHINVDVTVDFSKRK